MSLPVSRLLSIGSIIGLGYTAWDSNWDFRDIQVKTKTKHHVFLIRHGQYTDNPPGRVRGLVGHDKFLANDSLWALTELGMAQAELTGEHLAKILDYEGLLANGGLSIRIFSSDMLRAKQTAQIVHKHINMAANVLICTPNPNRKIQMMMFRSLY
jgi:broad specificity phosphatase PhoE